MKFKVKKGCELYNKLVELKDTIHSANKSANKLVEKSGFTLFRPDTFGLAGGVSSFHSETKPEGFKYTYGPNDPTDFFPIKNKANKELLEAIENLPKVEYNHLNDLVDYDPKLCRDGKSIFFAPGISWHKDVVLLDFPDSPNYKPVAGMTEITFSEYNTIRCGPKRKKAAKQLS